MKNQVRFRNPIKAIIVKKDGTEIEVPMVENGVVDVGFNHLLGVAFRAQSQIANWYIGLIESEGLSLPVLADGDTMASHAWTEVTTYSEANRQQWTPTVVDDQTINNSSAVEFTFNAASAIRGIFISSSNTKGGTAGTLWSTALFAANMDFVNTEKLRIIYTVSAS